MATVYVVSVLTCLVKKRSKNFYLRMLNCDVTQWLSDEPPEMLELLYATKKLWYDFLLSLTESDQSEYFPFNILNSKTFKIKECSKYFRIPITNIDDLIQISSRLKVCFNKASTKRIFIFIFSQNFSRNDTILSKYWVKIEKPFVFLRMKSSLIE